MNSKLIGFILSKNKIEYKPLLNTEVQVKDILHSSGVLSLYYYGDENKISVNQLYSMGFPASDNLLDHNCILRVLENCIEIENDWLGSIPVFYNQQAGIVSSFPKVCLTDDKSFDHIGLSNYLKYGFSVFGRTPFQSVLFMPFFSKLIFGDRIEIMDKEDPVKQIDQYKGASEDDIWEEISRYSLNVEAKTSGTIVIPTSAGFDSRIVNYSIHDHDRVKNYSYGISSHQSKSFEVQEARKFAHKMGHTWDQIYLKEAYNQIHQWHDLFAFSTHLHGMYHIEFYQKVLSTISTKDLSMVSGICGGVFTGSNQYQKIDDAKDIYKLAFTHGLNFNLEDNKADYSLEKEFLQKYSYLFNDLRLYPIITMRIKLILLSYLMTIPSVMGIPAWTPFLNFSIVMKMLNLPNERRKDRLWVKAFFDSKGLLPAKKMFFQDTRNRLNFNMFLHSRFEPIDPSFINPLVDSKAISKLNDSLGNVTAGLKLNYYLTTTRIIKEILKKAGITNKFNDDHTSYQTLKAIEMSLKG